MHHCLSVVLYEISLLIAMYKFLSAENHLLANSIDV
jgi:hypothetical protein